MGKRVLWFLAMGLSVAALDGAVGGCGSVGSDNPPDVEGLYDQTATDCPAGLFDTTINVVQTGDDITLEGTNAGFIDAVGTINNNGDFEVSNVNGTCEGDINETTGVATATCTSTTGDECDLTYRAR